MQTMAPPEQGQRGDLARINERFDRTDERIVNVDRRVAEAAKETDRRFKEINRRITESNEDTNRRFEEVNRRIDENTAEVKGPRQEMGGLRQEISALQTTFQRGNYTLIATIVAALLAFLIKGG